MSALQQEVAELWMGLTLRGSCGPGTLSVCQAGDDSLAFTLACIGCGGAMLLLAHEKAEGRQAAQSGAVDFVVDTMSEALRILKNEVRQHRSIAVALVGVVEAHAAAMEERGVQPQFVEAVLQDCAPWQVLVQRGAVPVVCEKVRQHGLTGAALEQLSLQVDVTLGLAGRRAVDEKLAGEASVARAGPARSAAQQWMRLAPRLFPRDRERVFWQYQQQRSAQ